MTAIISASVHIVATILAITALASTHWATLTLPETLQTPPTTLGLWSANGESIDSACRFSVQMGGNITVEQLPLCNSFNAVRAFSTISVVLGLTHVIMGAVHLYSVQFASWVRDFHIMSVTGALAGGCKFVAFLTFAGWSQGQQFNTSSYGGGFGVAVASGCIHALAVIIRTCGQRIFNALSSVCC